MKKKIRESGVLWAALSALLVGAALNFWTSWTLVFCYLPLWFFFLRRAQSWKQIFIVSFTYQILLATVTSSWVVIAVHDYSSLSWPLSVLCLLCFACTELLYLTLSALLCWWLRNRFKIGDCLWLGLLAATNSLGEIFWPNIFHFHLGYGLLPSTSFAQWSDVFGFEGLSFFILLFNAGLLFCLITDKKSIKKWGSIFLVCFLLVFHFSGEQKKKYWSDLSANASKHLNILIVQPNLGHPNEFTAKEGSSYRGFILNRLYASTDRALKNQGSVDLILWPENAVPDYLDQDNRSSVFPEQLRQYVISKNKSLLTGAYSKDFSLENSENDPEYNALFLLNRSGDSIQRVHRKIDLMPFAEVYPWKQKANVHSGKEVSLISFAINSVVKNHNGLEEDSQIVKIGPQICYESVKSSYSKKMTKMGADIFLNATNDYWFGKTSEPKQSFISAMARGLENRRPMIRVANTGISGVMLADGQIVAKSPVFEEWSERIEIPIILNAPKTFYTDNGELIPILILFFAVLCLLSMKCRLSGYNKSFADELDIATKTKRD